MRIIGLTLLVSAGLGLALASFPAAPQGDSLLPGAIQIDATFAHLGVVWWIEGDDDLDSTFSVDFRPLGEPAWQAAAPAMRAYPTLRVQDDPLGLNYWAASALFLKPATTYELRLTLTDPDGGGASQTVTATTRSWPAPDASGRQLFVAPGSGGGDGSPGNPFLGLQAAADVAQAGDTFHVAAGSYLPFQLLASGSPGQPIVFRGAPGGASIVDGGGTDRGVITLGEYNQTIHDVIVQGLTIQNGHWGVDLQHSQEIYLHHNWILDVDDGIVNRRGAALEANQTICDNVILGRTPWPGTGIPSERGIDLKGSGNVVCHNLVQYFGDCVSVQPSTGPSFGNDVYGNDVSYCVDDGIEVDYNQSNVRVWRNRAMNARMGVSLQPIRGGPAYIFRNEMFNLESVPVKMHNYTTGFYVIHNSGAKHVNGYGDNGAMWRNTVLRNNLFLGTRYAFEFTTVADEGFRDFDYNSWGTTRTIDPGGPHFKWDDVRYDTLADLPSGVEDHGQEALFSHLVNAALPAWWDQPAAPGSRNLALMPGAPQINAGSPLPNLNDPFVFDGLPDLGAFEFGQAYPLYGPRPLAPDLSTSMKQASHPTPVTDQVITYTLSLRNTGAPLTYTATLTDIIPAGLSYLTGTFQASSGVPEDGSAPLLLWSGSLEVESAVTLTYAVRVATVSPQVIINTAQMKAGPLVSWSLETAIVANGSPIYLPVIFSD